MNPSDSLQIDEHLARLLAAYDQGIGDADGKAPTLELKPASGRLVPGNGSGAPLPAAPAPPGPAPGRRVRAPPPARRGRGRGRLSALRPAAAAGGRPDEPAAGDAAEPGRPPAAHPRGPGRRRASGLSSISGRGI